MGILYINRGPRIPLLRPTPHQGILPRVLEGKMRFNGSAPVFSSRPAGGGGCTMEQCSRLLISPMFSADNPDEHLMGARFFIKISGFGTIYYGQSSLLSGVQVVFLSFSLFIWKNCQHHPSRRLSTLPHTIVLRSRLVLLFSPAYMLTSPTVRKQTVDPQLPK